MTNERMQAAAIADRFLDEPYADPDGDACVLARQFNRSQEEIERLRAGILEIAQTAPMSALTRTKLERLAGEPSDPASPMI